jgi:hypothetical protein
MTFSIELRGLNSEQIGVVLNCLQEPTNYVTIREVQRDYIKVEVDEHQRLILTLGDSIELEGGLAEIKSYLAGTVNFACRQRSDLFQRNAEYGWHRRIWFAE